MKKTLTAEEKKRLSRLAELPCVVCGYSPVEIHHLRNGMGFAQKNDAFHAIPLCARHHRVGGYGVAFHAGKESFESTFGTEEELLAKTNKMLKEQESSRIFNAG